MKNILQKIKNNYFINTLIFAFIIALFINPLAKLTWNFLILMSSRFSLYLINKILRLAISERMPLDIFIFIFAFFAFMLVSLSVYITIARLPFGIKKKSVNKSPMYRRYIFIALSIFLLIEFIFILETYTIAFELNVNYKQRMGIIAPYINNEKEEELWSKWYLIESKIDYINLNHELDNIAENNNIKLPKALK